MASDDSAAGLPPERQRPAPTIDLKANEVSSRAIDSGGQSSEEPAAEASESVASPEPAGGPAETAPGAPAADPRPAYLRPVLWAASACAAIALVGLGTWLGISFMNRDDQLSQMTARLVRIEAMLANVPAAENAAKATADNVASLSKRIDEIAGNVRDASGRADSAAAAAEAARKAAGSVPDHGRGDSEALSNRIVALEQGRGDSDAISNRIGALEQAARSNERELAADDKVSRRAVVASALRDTVERGNPFAAELAAAKPFAADAASLAPLEDFATTGIPSVPALARELSALAQPMMNAIGEPPRPDGLMEKIQASAQRLVRIRPVGDVPGDEPANVVARIEAKAARNDIAGALADLAKLPAQVRAPAESWIKRATARGAALAASRTFAQDSLSALGKPSL